jgi:hypothetical protein
MGNDHLRLAAAAWTSVQLIKEKHRQINVAKLFAIRPSSKENEGFDFTRSLRKNIYHSDADLRRVLFLMKVADEGLMLGSSKANCGVCSFHRCAPFQ